MASRNSLQIKLHTTLKEWTAESDVLEKTFAFT